MKNILQSVFILDELLNLIDELCDLDKNMFGNLNSIIQFKLPKLYQSHFI